MLRRRALTLVEVIVLFFVISMLAALCLPAVQASRTPARRNMCRNNMRQLGLGTLNYESDHGSLPAAYTVNPAGEQLHSWRSHLLPYVEEPRLHAIIDFTRAWNTVANVKPSSFEIDAFRCPRADLEGPETGYLAVVGPGFAYSGATPTKFDDITDGRAGTLLLVDAPVRHAQHWMAPQGLDEAKFLSYSPELSCNHHGVVLVGFADGHTEAIRLDCDSAVRRAMLTIAGAERINMDAL